MKCIADDCNREAEYKEACLCQKHYFRVRRNGHTNLLEKTRQYRVTMPGRDSSNTSSMQPQWSSKNSTN